jgi:hypothetical protein
MNYSLHNTIVKSIVKHSFTLISIIGILLSLIAMLLPCYCHWAEGLKSNRQAGFKGLLVILSFKTVYLEIYNIDENDSHVALIATDRRVKNDNIANKLAQTHATSQFSRFFSFANV